MIQGINHITLAVRNVELSFEFYTKILGLRPVAKWDKGAYLKIDDTWIALNLDAKVADAKRIDYSHIAFTCNSSDYRSLRTRLLTYGCAEWSENRSEGDSFYFLDPDGHRLEIHVGDLESRLRNMHDNPWADFQYY
jgi:catechol 2,3-dioxygenase-like lactoylglutathione lyase family enzyme